MMILGLRKADKFEIIYKEVSLIGEKIHKWDIDDIIEYLIRDRQLTKEYLREMTGLTYREIHIIRHYCHYFYSDETTFTISRDHIIAFCVALRVDRDVSDIIIGNFGYALREDDERDSLIRYIMNRSLNEEFYNLPVLNSCLISNGFEPLTNVKAEDGDDIRILEWM